jgi:hypothetical protein
MRPQPALTSIGRCSFTALLTLALVAGGCVVRPLRGPPEVVPPGPSQLTDRAIIERILALDPEHVTDADVRQTLAKGPTPRIMLLHGGIYPVHLSMESFGRFLVGMGYPEARIRDPYDASWSHSPYEDAERLAGIAAWHYEKDGMPPMLIGHSQGGMQAIKVLHVLNGEYSAAVSVWNPLTDFAEGRTVIVDPLTGNERPVVGLKLSYASAVGAGGAAFLLPNQWSMLGKLRTIPDTVDEFVGYSIALDLWAWTVGDATRRFENGGRAKVRNVTLDAENSHVLVPVTAQLAGDASIRQWINAYVPGTTAPPPPNAGENLQWAADVWYSVKKHWVLEAQRLIRVTRAGAQPAVAGKLE